MRLTRSLSLVALLSPFVLLGACSVDLDGLLFDDDEFAKVSGEGGAGGALVGGDGDGDGDAGGAPGDGDGDGDITEPECTMVGELRCDGKQVQVCSGFEFIDVGSECEFVCSEGACGGACVPGATQCESATTQIACGTDGEWSAPTTCTNACLDGACGGECEPGARDCGGPDEARRLCDDSATWIDQGACSGGGACQDGVCTSCSVDGETQCNAGQVETCDGSNWVVSENCSFVCLTDENGDADCGGECVPKSQQCGGPNGSVRQFCNSTGAWENGEVCPYLCNDNISGATECTGECLPGSLRCQGTAIEECDDTGNWVVSTDCGKEGLICAQLGNTPDCRVCQPNDTRCNVLSVETCDEKGTGWSATDECNVKTEACLLGQCRTKAAILTFCEKFDSGQGCLSSTTEWSCVKGSIQESECSRLETCGPTSCTLGRGG